MFDNPSYFTLQSNNEKQKRQSDNGSQRSLTPPRYKSNRSFLRSISTNSADSNHSNSLILMGEPRLEDIAPDLVDKNKHKLCAFEEDEDEVFISEDNSRASYYNIRRHSISSFLRPRTSSTASSSTKSFKEPLIEQIDGLRSGVIVDDHELRHASYSRKRCIKCRGTYTKQTNMDDDILIVSLKASEAATLWVDYFSNYFLQISKQANRKPFKIKSLTIEELIKPDLNPPEKHSMVKLQLIVLCPNFLDFISHHPEETSVLNKILLADRTLALLLGVADNDLNDVHKKVLSTYFHWQRQTVGQDQDETFTKEFLGQAMAILSRVWKQQSSVVAQEKAGFSVTPKKIRQGQNSVFIILTHPLQKDDIVKVSVERNGELHEIKTIKKRNPYLIKFSVPENLTDITAIVNVLVEKNGNIVGSRPIKCESKLRELEQILKSVGDPLEFMNQTLGLNPIERENLDNWLVMNFQKNLPGHFNLLASHSTPFASAMLIHKHSYEEFPTLLHFAAKFGLEKLVIQLLDCPGADLANEIRNISDMTAIEIAELNGHMQLASMLRGYMSMNEVTSMYTKLKEISQSTTKGNVEEEELYLTPKNMESFYKMCPVPRPLTYVEPDMTKMHTPPTTPISECTTPLGYTTMNTVQPTPSTSTANQPKKPQPKKQNNSISIHQMNEDKVQNELAEIILDFKNNVHSIGQVEKLVEDWKNRNDVQKSFKEKQEQLLLMRQRYDRIQSDMRKEMKKNLTPFERVKRLFVRPKPSSATSPVVMPLLQQQRPVSSMSSESSSSSGRMSTISACSLGDSGTHSDNEERKNQMLNSQNEDEFRNELNRAILQLNYTPLPAPKPVKTNNNNRHKFETIEEKPVTRPDTLPLNNDDFYLQFTPSGLPVPTLNSPSCSKIKEEAINKEMKAINGARDYMNVSATGSALLEAPDYMNLGVESFKPDYKT